MPVSAGQRGLHSRGGARNGISNRVYESTTAASVRAIEEGAGSCRMQWLANGLPPPMNPATGSATRAETRSRYGSALVEARLWFHREAG
jgi:hypothetical protein